MTSLAQLPLAPDDLISPAPCRTCPTLESFLFLSLYLLHLYPLSYALHSLSSHSRCPCSPFSLICLLSLTIFSLSTPFHLLSILLFFSPLLTIPLSLFPSLHSSSLFLTHTSHHPLTSLHTSDSPYPSLLLFFPFLSPSPTIHHLSPSLRQSHGRHGPILTQRLRVRGRGGGHGRDV